MAAGCLANELALFQIRLFLGGSIAKIQVPFITGLAAGELLSCIRRHWKATR